jgi:hypothetical protein
MAEMEEMEEMTCPGPRVLLPQVATSGMIHLHPLLLDPVAHVSVQALYFHQNERTTTIR